MKREIISLKRNVLYNYISQVYITGIGILVLPLYMKYMGAEAYGLVGFFTMLQAWFSLMDLGLTPTIARETARFQGEAISALAYRKIFRALSLIFVIIAALGCIALLLLSNQIATSWLSVEDLSRYEVEFSLQVMAISVALRWMGGLYRGVVTGSEQLVWLSAFNIFITTARFVMVFPVMWHYGFTPIVFFIYQLSIALLEASILFFKARYLLPSKLLLKEKIGWSFKPIRPLLKFSLTIAFTSSVWVMLTQTDKLILSGVLSLADYGYFVLAVLVANGIIASSGPISSAILPRMARLHSEGRHEEMINVYRGATQLVSVIAGSAALTLVLGSYPLLYAWTGDAVLAENAAPILQLYAIGNGMLVISAFPYYLQYAKGNLRYHLIGNTAMMVLLIPCVIWAAIHFGGVGAGYVWIAMNTVYLFFGVTYIHYRLVPGLQFDWLKKDVCFIILPPILIFVPVLINISYVPHSRLASIIFVVVVALLILIFSAVMTKKVQFLLSRFVERIQNNFN